MPDFLLGEKLLVDKPLEWTSFDVVNKLRGTLQHLKLSDGSRPYKKIKVGHAGTLDPLATGLLIVCTGKATKSIETLMGLEKEYTGTFTLGATTPSYDAETPVNKTFDIAHITTEQIHQAAQTFIGETEQLPPAHSAVIIQGERAYEKARRGEEVKVTPRKINIHDFEITEIAMPVVSFRVVCSKGTYIRSLANDFGKALNSGSYLSSLIRTRIGDFKLSAAHTVEHYVDAIRNLHK